MVVLKKRPDDENRSGRLNFVEVPNEFGIFPVLEGVISFSKIIATVL